jgi:WD40 repeat protein
MLQLSRPLAPPPAALYHSRTCGLCQAAREPHALHPRPWRGRVNRRSFLLGLVMSRIIRTLLLAVIPAACSDPVAPPGTDLPPGRLAFTDGTAVYAYDMGGDTLTRLVDIRSRCVSRHPDGERLLLEDLLVLDSSTGLAARIPTQTESIIAGCGEFTADGEWIYLTARRSTEDAWISNIWRIRPDGTQLEQITSGHRAYFPSPSPDGTRIAYIREGILGSANADYLVIATLGTSVLDTIAPPISGCAVHNCYTGITRMRWSPTGEWIAYATRSETLSNGARYASLLRYASLVRLVRPDGSETRYIGPPGADPHDYGFWGGVSWSPNGEWLAGPAYPDSRIGLVHIGSGDRVLLNEAIGQPWVVDWMSH